MADIATVEEREIREKRAKVFAGMAPIMEKVRSGIELTDSERSEFDKRNKKLAALDADLRRVQDYNKLAAVTSDSRDARQDARGAMSGDAGVDRIYEEAFLEFLRSGHTDNMDDTHRQVFRAYSTPQVIRRAPTTARYEQFVDTHGATREVGYKNLRTADIVWDEQRTGANGTPLDSSGLSTAPNSAGIAAGATGFDAGYLIPQGFWHNLQIALKEYGGLLPYVQMLQTDSGQPMPWPTVL